MKVFSWLQLLGGLMVYLLVGLMPNFQLVFTRTNKLFLLYAFSIIIDFFFLLFSEFLLQKRGKKSTNEFVRAFYGINMCIMKSNLGYKFVSSLHSDWMGDQLQVKDSTSKYFVACEKKSGLLQLI